MRFHRKPAFALLMLVVAACSTPLLPNVALAQPGKITLDRPGDREFVRDEAHLLTPADVAKINAIGEKLLTEKATPIIVVTIESMAAHGGAGMRIETFANLLFDQWQVGVAKVNGQDWNTGIMLLVSKGDRKARIELGDHWRHDQDKLAQQIMSEQIVPHFRQGDFPGGILAGVEALDKMARGLTLPAPANSSAGSSGGLAGGSSGPPQWLMIVLAIGAVVTIISLIRSGSKGWAWIGWGLLFGLIGTILYQMLTNHNSSGGSGGGYTGGGFDGGFSGGGGATGDW